jgi:ribosome-associated protein
MPDQTVAFNLTGEYVKLSDLLKLTGLADSGGRGKAMVEQGLVKVDGKVESRKTAKIRAGQTIECGQTRITVSG